MKKLSLFIFSLIVSLVLLCGLSAQASATLSMVDGAQVRTATPAGLRFQATASNLAETDEHGFYLALGTHTLSDMRTAIEAGASTVGGNKLVKKSTTGEEPTFAVTVYDIPEEYYTAGITAVAYLKTGEDYTLNIAVTRNIAEVALGQFKTAAPAEFLKDIVDTCYYAVNFSTSLKYYVAAGSIYENNVDKIKDEFLADWKAYDDSVDISTLHSAFGSDNRGKIRAFALADNTGARKWHWLWGYLSNYNVFRTEAQDIYNDSAEPYEDSGYTLLYQTFNFFANKSWKAEYEGVNPNLREIYFWEHPEYYSQIDVYNNTLEADHTDAGTEYVLKGGTYTLLDYDNVLKDYYDVTGWNDGSSTQVGGTSYTLSAAKTFKPMYTATTYTVTYMDGEENISASFDASKKSFTVESAIITLPTYEKDGYVFEGWYDNVGLTGDSVETIPAGSHENIVFYAKMTESNNVPVNVTYNLNGGTWKKAQLEELFTPAATVNIDYYRTYDDQYGYHVTLSPAQAGEWWYYILLEKTQYEGVYCINQIVYRKSSITEYYDLLITWHNACQDEMAKTVLTSIYNDRATYAGYYVTLSGIPSDNATTITTASIVAKFYSNINSDCNTSYTLRTALPIPARLGYTFEGWKSSIDGINYTTFPGYESSPGDIAYTAQWTEADPLTISALRTQFLNDLNTASGLSTTADTFYATYAEKLIVNSSGEKAGYLIDNVELREKYMWLFEYAINHGINESAVGNEYLAYAASVLGIEYFGTTDAATSDLNYADRAFTNTLYNILNDTAIKDETLTGNASALANPNVETPYIGLIFNSSE